MCNIIASIPWSAIYGFIQAHQTAFGYVLVAGVNALPIPGTKFNIYEFMYHWLRSLTPLSHRQPADTNTTQGVSK